MQFRLSPQNLVLAPLLGLIKCGLREVIGRAPRAGRLLLRSEGLKALLWVGGVCRTGGQGRNQTIPHSRTPHSSLAPLAGMKGRRSTGGWWFLPTDQGPRVTWPLDLLPQPLQLSAAPTFLPGDRGRQQLAVRHTHTWDKDCPSAGRRAGHRKAG